jgi:hypothetical protein
MASAFILACFSQYSSNLAMLFVEFRSQLVPWLHYKHKNKGAPLLANKQQVW